MESEDRTTHFGLRGRATNVLPVKSDTLSSLPWAHHGLNDTEELVAKLYWPEGSRQSEADILEEVFKIADGKWERMTEEERKQVDAMSRRWSGSTNSKTRPRRASGRH